MSLPRFGEVTDPAILVMAKAPIPGRVKTRLCPPCTPLLAARIAQAALGDTLDAALGTGRTVVVALDGPTGPWLPPGVEVFAQRGAGFDERLTNAWADFGRAGVQIGMDTPQVSISLLCDALATLDDAPSALGLALDGGWWVLALRAPHPECFVGIEMSRADTGAQQWDRLVALGLDPQPLTPLRDIDTWANALEVADHSPEGTALRTIAAVGAARAWQDGPR
jgi:glycosyltransferase A (GT-A) superfamily protein (DUF2064 family)